MADKAVAYFLKYPDVPETILADLCDHPHTGRPLACAKLLSMYTDDRQQDWRARAQEMRALGDQMHDQLAREEMLWLANKYERLADWAQERSRLPAR
jgi:predicted nucleic acid-binding Zn ribbon protein